MTVKDRPHIDYAPPLRLYRRRRVRVAVAAVLSLITVFGMWWGFGPAAWLRVKVLYWQSKSMRYTARADKVVYEDDHDELSRYMTGDPRWGGYGETTGTYHGGLMFEALPWYEFYDLYSPPGRVEAPTLFLHARTNGRHATRLVAVELLGTDYAMSPGPFSPGSRLMVAFTVSVLQPASALRNPDPLTENTVRLDLGRHEAKDHFQCFAGQIDSADPSHFTIRYQLNGKPGKIDGWLLDDDTVRLEVRGGTVSQ